MDNELRLKAIFDQAAVGFAFIESRTGRLVKVNKKLCDIIGFKKGSGSSDTFMSITHPDDLQEDLDNMEKLLKGDVREFSMEKRYIRKDGSIVWGNLTVSALWDVGQSPDYHIAIVEDITARKKAEEDLKSLNLLLDKRISESTVELQEKSKKLAEANCLLKEKESELLVKNKSLNDLNVALKVLLHQKEDNRLELEENLMATMKVLVEPCLNKLTLLCPDVSQKNLINLINRNLKELASPFSNKLSSGYINLTKTEIQVSDHIKSGRSNREIAELINISIGTVAVHRKNIRKKLGISNTKTNLRSCLKALE
jgi:PAS domain S-box-containing protein